MATSTVTTRRETASLIGTDKVEGTAVYGADQQKIGNLQRVMIDKVSGKVAYAVVSFGGFLGMGEDYFPMPWASLTYDTNLGGYRTNMTESQLKGAPKYNRNTEWDWSDRSRDRAVYDYYKAPLWYENIMPDERSQEDRQRDSENRKDAQGQQAVQKPGFAWGDPKEGTGSQSGGAEGGLGGG